MNNKITCIFWAFLLSAGCSNNTPAQGDGEKQLHSAEKGNHGARKNPQIEELPIEVKNVKYVSTTVADVLTKHRFRSQEKDGWKVDVWTASTNVPMYSFGLRIAKENATGPPKAELLLLLRRGGGEGRLLGERYTPELKTVAIPGGYFDSTVFDDGSRKGSEGKKFTGVPGTWERIIADPFRDNWDMGWAPYFLDAQIAIEGAPRFEFKDIKLRYAPARDPVYSRFESEAEYEASLKQNQGDCVHCVQIPSLSR